MAASNTAAGVVGSPGEIMLFGVRVVVDSMRKSVSLNNLSQYQQQHPSAKDKDEVVAAAGYASADDAPRSERKRGVPWTEEEHKLFLIGLDKVGKGDWRGISRNFVKTRTPTQVASHAQKYFLRRLNLNRRRRRSSLFDITTDTATGIEDQSNPKEKMLGSNLLVVAAEPTKSKNSSTTINNFVPAAVMSAFSLSSSSSPTGEIPVDNLSSGQQQCINNGGSPHQNLILPVQHVDDPSSYTHTTTTSSSRMIDLNLSSPPADPFPLSLSLSSLTSDQRHFAYRTMMATALSA